MDTPLTKWYCDICNAEIKNVKDGLVIFDSKMDNRNVSITSNFRIIHKVKCDKKDSLYSLPLENFIGENGVNNLLFYLSPGLIHKFHTNGDSYPHKSVESLDNFADFFRRVQLPYYEEARKYFKNDELYEDYCEENIEELPYKTNELKRIINKYSI